MTTTSPRVTKVEDHEGDGTCQSCGREGIRWIATLSDGSQVGVECAKKVTGSSVPVKMIEWTTNYTPIAEHTEHGETFVLWQHKQGSRTVTSRNGLLQSVGGQREEWRRMGWAA